MGEKAHFYPPTSQTHGAISAVPCPIRAHFFTDKGELAQINGTAHTVYVRWHRRGGDRNLLAIHAVSLLLSGLYIKAQFWTERMEIVRRGYKKHTQDKRKGQDQVQEIRNKDELAHEHLFAYSPWHLSPGSKPLRRETLKWDNGFKWALGFVSLFQGLIWLSSYSESSKQIITVITQWPLFPVCKHKGKERPIGWGKDWRTWVLQYFLCGPILIIKNPALIFNQ